METQTVQQPQPQNGVQKFSESTVDGVLKRISAFQSTGEMRLPSNYSAENAVRSAWLIIQETKNLDKRPALEVCTKESVANALLDMVLQGLSPVKKQCYFVVYGNKLVMQKSYMGTMAVSKRVANVKSVRALPIYKGDEFAFEIDTATGIKKVTKHVQSFENIDPANVIGAYAIVTYNDDTVRSEVMNMKQIRASWEMGQSKGNSKAHNGFADEMACKTVIGRALKIDINSSDDGDLFDEPIEPMDIHTANVQHQIAENGNKTEIGFDEDMSSQQNSTVEDEPSYGTNQNGTEETTANNTKLQSNGQPTKAPF